MHRHSILLIEDEPELSALLEEILEAYEVRVAPTMAKAREILSDFDPCLVVSDLSLPDVSRDDVIPSIRSVAPRPPILVMSAIARADLEAIGREHGATRIISKPFSLDEFEEALVFDCGKEEGASA